jgi:hypothetical protein
VRIKGRVEDYLHAAGAGSTCRHYEYESSAVARPPSAEFEQIASTAGVVVGLGSKKVLAAGLMLRGADVADLPVKRPKPRACWSPLTKLRELRPIERSSRSPNVAA